MACCSISKDEFAEINNKLVNIMKLKCGFYLSDSRVVVTWKILVPGFTYKAFYVRGLARGCVGVRVRMCTA